MNSKMTYLFYGMPAFGLSVVGIPLYIYLPTFYTLDLGVDVGYVGLILLLARLLDMLFDPLVGALSDRIHIPFGKRKPWIVFGTGVLLVGYYGLINPIFKENLALWLFVFSVLTYAGWSSISVAYMALSAEISDAYHEKSLIASSREMIGILGMISALAIPYALGVSNVASETLKSLYTLLLISLPIGVGLLCLGVREKKSDHPRTTSLPWDITLPLLWNSKARHLIAAYVLNSLANAIPSTLFLYFMTFVIGDATQSGPLLILYFISGIVGLPFWLWLSLKIGKPKAWIASMLFCALSFVWVPFLGEGDTFWFALIVFASGLGLGADLTLSSSLQADVAQSYESSNASLSGLLFGIWAMGTKLSLALGVAISFGILGLLDFQPNAINEASKLGISLIYGLLPVLLKGSSILFILKFK